MCKVNVSGRCLDHGALGGHMGGLGCMAMVGSGAAIVAGGTMFMVIAAGYTMRA